MSPNRFCCRTTISIFDAGPLIFRIFVNFVGGISRFVPGFKWTIIKYRTAIIANYIVIRGVALNYCDSTAFRLSPQLWLPQNNVMKRNAFLLQSLFLRPMPINVIEHRLFVLDIWCR